MPFEVTLMAGLLAIGVFLENYARTRAHRAADRSSESGALVADEVRYRLADQGRPDASARILRTFDMPLSVRLAPSASLALAVLNVTIYGLILLHLRNESI